MLRPRILVAASTLGSKPVTCGAFDFLRFRFLTLLLCIGVTLLNIPLYRLVKQDYIPTNVDESEFEIGINAREGASLTAMNEAMQVAERELNAIPGVEFILTTAGSRGFGGINSGNIYVRLTPAAERTFSLERFAKDLFRGKPQAAFEGNSRNKPR